MDAAMASALAQPSTPLPNQVAGHDGVMSDASGSLVIKPALPREIAFYQLVAESPRSAPIRRLKPFVPRFFGTLRLEGQLDAASGQVKTADSVDTKSVPESVVLENLSHGFTRASVLDVKLGTVLHEPSAAPEKRERMEKQAKETTTRETGLRLTGCQTWHEPTQSYILTPKSFGKTIKVAQLPDGMQRFFPLPNDVVPSLVQPMCEIDTEQATNASTSTGPAADPHAASSIPSPTPPPPVHLSPLQSNSAATEYTSHALPPHLVSRVLALVDAELGRLEAVLAELEIRFVGGSVLVVYEGEPARLAAAIERHDSKPPPSLTKGKAATSTAGADDEDEDEDDDNLSDLSASDSEGSDSDDDDGRKEEERVRRRCPPVRLRMIDFAHTWLAQGEGPDEGVLLGLKTLRGLVQDRKALVDAAAAAV